MFDQAFIEDRKKMAPGLDLERIKRIVPGKLLQLAQNLERLERQLADGRAFLLGAAPSLADLSAYHTHFFLKTHPLTDALLQRHARVNAWLGRVAAIGHADRKELDAADAIAIAHDATAGAVRRRAGALPDGLAYGDRVVVTARGDRLRPDHRRAAALRRPRDRDPPHGRARGRAGRALPARGVSRAAGLA